MFTYAHGETVVRNRAAIKTDRYGDSVRDWSNATYVTYNNVPVWALSSTEANDPGRDYKSMTYRIALPFNADVMATDRFQMRDGTWTVEGEPQKWLNPYTGRQVNMTVDLKRVEG